MFTQNLFRSVFIVSSLTQVLSAAVDCTAPRTRQQRVVCANPDLVQLDRQLTTAFQKTTAMVPGAASAQIQSDQETWENESSGCWDRVDCIKKRYTDRIAVLESLVAQLAVSKSEQTPTTARRRIVGRQPAGDDSEAVTSARLRQERESAAQDEARQAANSARFQERLQEAAVSGEARQRANEDRLAANSARFEAKLRDAEREAQKQHAEAEQKKAQAKAANAEAAKRYEDMSGVKERLISTLAQFRDFGPLPTLDSTALPYRPHTFFPEEQQAQIAQDQRTNADEIENQLPVVRAELVKRQQQGLDYAKDVLQKNKPLPSTQVNELAGLIANAASSPNNSLQAYQAAKKLEVDVRVLAVSKERAEKAIASAKADIQAATKYPNDQGMVAAASTTAKSLTELSTAMQSTEPKDATQISVLAGKLVATDNVVKTLIRQSSVLSTPTGKRVYEGCTTWAKRKGTMSSDAPLQVFKDAETNRAADFAANAGRYLCGCMTVEIASDKEITDQAKLEIARQLETRNRIDNQVLAMIVAVAGSKCQLKLTNELSGGALSRQPDASVVRQKKVKQ